MEDATPRGVEQPPQSDFPLELVPERFAALEARIDSLEVRMNRVLRVEYVDRDDRHQGLSDPMG